MTVQLDTTPYWMESAPLPHFGPLDQNEIADVVVVGAGITGLTAAHLLLSAGHTVAVLERRRAVESETGHTSGHLTMVTDLPLTDLVKQFGRDHAQAAWHAGLAAIWQIDEIIQQERITCDFAWVPGYLHAAPGRSNADGEWLQEEARIGSALGFDATFVSDIPLVHAPGVRFGQQARMHPRKYLAGLLRGVLRKGGHIYEHSEATDFSDTPRFVGANGYRISCGDIVIATHNPLVGNQSLMSAALFQTKLSLYLSYVVAGSVKKNTVPDALLWDTADPYHYYRVAPQRDSDLVLYGGEDHKTGQEPATAKRFARLAARLRALVPGISLTHQWSGQVVETQDGLPFIGEQVAHQFAGTGYSGNGLTFGTLAAMMASDRILGRSNPWTDLFATDRKNIRSAWNYLKENKDYPYYLIRDRFTGSQAGSLRAIEREQGQVIDYNGERVAAYRDANGTLTLRSALCTHMGCVVGWNEAEQSWDCPCHGSRFTPDGRVMSGPATSSLADVKDT